MPCRKWWVTWEERISYGEVSYYLMGPTGSWTHEHYTTGSHEHPLS
jgi:hypothetical protein